MTLLNEAQRLKLFEVLHQSYPHPKCELNWTTPWELMMAIILSAQSTDKNVNKTTPALFAVANTPDKALKLGIDGITPLVKTVNYFNNKTKSIVNLAHILVQNYNGKIPTDFNTLITLPGIGRKTASVFLNVAYHAPFIGVDTHVFRLAHRLKICTGKTPQEVQNKLEKLVPEKYKPTFALAMVLLGRYICTARKPKCFECPLYDVCLSDEKVKK